MSIFSFVLFLIIDEHGESGESHWRTDVTFVPCPYCGLHGYFLVEMYYDDFMLCSMRTDEVYSYLDALDVLTRFWATGHMTVEQVLKEADIAERMIQERITQIWRDQVDRRNLLYFLEALLEEQR